MANLRIQRLPANQAWAITFGDALIRLDNDMPMLWSSKSALIDALASRHLEVIDRKGTIQVTYDSPRC